ncbi:MAG: hypothetical protein WB791_07800 [Waddliaceae bacterium]
MVNFNPSNSSANIPLQPAARQEIRDAAVVPSPQSSVSETASKISSIQQAQFNEVIRRIPGKDDEKINEQLNQVTDEHLASLHSALKEPFRLYDADSPLRNDMFPCTALKALRNSEITAHEFGTLMRLWSIRDARMPDGSAPVAPRFVPLFQEDGSRNPEAAALLREGTQPPALPHLTKKKDHIEDIYSKVATLNPIEQGLWVVQDTTDFSRYHDEILPEKGQQYLYDHHTISQIIRGQLRLNWLSRISNDAAGKVDEEIAAAVHGGGKFRMVPSFGIQQALLGSAFAEPVMLNPVIGDSSVEDIRSGSKLRHRDIALPFLDCKLPEKADGFATPSPLDFMEHDFYHAIRASQVPSDESERFVDAGDRLMKIQQEFNCALRELNRRHKKHKESLPQLKQYVSTLPEEKREPVLKAVFEKYNREAELLAKMKRMRKGSGMLKFRLYDMEHFLYGGLFDPLVKPRLAFIMQNIFSNSRFIETLPWGTDIGAKFGQIIARQTLEAMNPSEKELSGMRANLLFIAQAPEEELRLMGISHKEKSFWEGMLGMTRERTKGVEQTA